MGQCDVAVLEAWVSQRRELELELGCGRACRSACVGGLKILLRAAGTAVRKGRVELQPIRRIWYLASTLQWLNGATSSKEFGHWLGNRLA